MAIHGIILAGGKASRMNGVDKGLQLLHSRPLVEHVLERLAPQVKTITISANRNISEYEKFQHDVIPDQATYYQGPMAGIATAMSHIRKTAAIDDWVILSPCDTPMLATNLVQRLTAGVTLPHQQHSALLPFDGKHRQTLFSILPLQLTDSIQDAVNENRLKVTDWLMSTQPLIKDLSDIADSFTNINTLDQLQSCQSQLP